MSRSTGDRFKRIQLAGTIHETIRSQTVHGPNGSFKRYDATRCERKRRHTRVCTPKLHTTLVTLFYGTRGTSHRTGFYLQCNQPVAWQGTAKGQWLQPVKTRRGNKFSPRISLRSPLEIPTVPLTGIVRNMFTLCPLQESISITSSAEYIFAALETLKENKKEE